MKLDDYVMQETNLTKKKTKEVLKVINEYHKKYEKKKLNIKVPNYTLGEEIFNSISHGMGALFSVVALILMIIKANGVKEEVTISLFGISMIVLYTISCIYHALSPNIEGKKVLRVIDHCNVYFLVYGTYIPISIVGIDGTAGWILFSIVTIVTFTGITLTAIKIDKFTILEVVCHLISGWSSLFFIGTLEKVLTINGLILLIIGGVMYTIGSILYGVGHKKKYMHCVFHIFCLLGTLFHFLCIYLYLI